MALNALLLFLLLLTAGNSHAFKLPDEDLGRKLFGRSLYSVARCARATDSCKRCYQSCSSYRPFFDRSYGALSVPSALLSCRVNVSQHRVGVAKWCLNDEKHFFSSAAFSATRKSCDMDAPTCATHLASLGASAKWPNAKLKVVEKVRKAGALLRTLRDKEAAYAETKARYARLRRWYSEDVLREMDAHLASPATARTRFSDKVYAEAVEVGPKAKREARYIASVNVPNERKLTAAARRLSALDIDRYIKEIRRLTNHLASRRDDTDAYLADAKTLSRQVHEAQLRATGLRHAEAHARGLDGEVDQLRLQMEKGLARLRSERLTLSREMNTAGKEKVKLVQGMRNMIEVISKHQRDAKCSTDNRFKA